MCGCEAYIDWLIAKEDQQFYEMFGFGEPRKGRAAYSSNEYIQ